MELKLLIPIMLFVISFAFLLYSIFSKKRFKNPEKILREIDIYVKDPNVPEYTAIQILEKAVKIHPEHKQLKEKLEELKKTYPNSSPKAFLNILAYASGITGMLLIISWLLNITYLHGLYFGSFFIICALYLRHHHNKYT